MVYSGVASSCWHLNEQLCLALVILSTLLEHCHTTEITT